MINRVLGTSFEPIHEPERAGDIKYSRANIGKITDLLDFAPVVDFDSGLARTIDWFKGTIPGSNQVNGVQVRYKVAVYNDNASAISDSRTLIPVTSS